MSIWDDPALLRAPKIFEADPTGIEGVNALFYEGLPWNGLGTRVFAYLGIPDIRSGESVPGMVLVHGGGGSALIPWVRLWTARGYAAIAMDTCGYISGGGHENHQRHAHGGPPGWGGFDQIDLPARDQWAFHAVADVLLAHSLLRSVPRVDPGRIGLTGVSWGGYLTCLAAAVDRRFAFAAPVYGCGFLNENSTWLDKFEKMGPDRTRRWVELWDPSAFLPRVRIPMLWVTGTNDFAFPLDSWQKSCRLPPSPRSLSLRVRMPHGHGGPGEGPPEIHAMAEALFRNGPGLPQIAHPRLEGSRIRAAFKSQTPIVQVELNFTTNPGPWLERHWESHPAELGVEEISAEVPAATTSCFLNLVDERGCTVSTEHVTFPSR